MSDKTVVYKVVNNEGEAVEVTLNREEAREIERSAPGVLKVVRCIATPDPREDGGA